MIRDFWFDLPNLVGPAQNVALFSQLIADQKLNVRRNLWKHVTPSPSIVLDTASFANLEIPLNVEEVIVVGLTAFN